MNAVLNYQRMPGFGDLPGDSRHPNSPSYVEPDYGYEDADTDIAAELDQAGEVAELVMEVRNAAGLLDWIAHNVDLPAHLLQSFRDLDRRARGLRRRADDLCEAALTDESLHYPDTLPKITPPDPLAGFTAEQLAEAEMTGERA